MRRTLEEVGFSYFRVEVNSQWVNNVSVPILRGMTKAELFKKCKRIVYNYGCHYWDINKGTYFYKDGDIVEIKRLI